MGASVTTLDLFARRATELKGAAGAKALAELEAIVEHLLFREFPHLSASPPGGGAAAGPLAARAALMLDEAAGLISALMAGWLRVGFCQGNFNADNCLVAGRTMDYGPFGFMDKYDPAFAKWTGSGDHFAFANQPAAGLANWQTLAEVEPGWSQCYHSMGASLKQTLAEAVAPLLADKRELNEAGWREPV